MPFEVRKRYKTGHENSKRNLTVIHQPSNIEITSPDYTQQEKSDEELKKEAWEVMKKAMEIWKIK